MAHMPGSFGGNIGSEISRMPLRDVKLYFPNVYERERKRRAKKRKAKSKKK